MPTKKICLAVLKLATFKISKSPLMNSAGWLIHDGIRHLVRPSSSLGNGNTCIIEQWFSASPRCLSDFRGIRNGAIKLHLLCYFVQTGKWTTSLGLSLMQWKAEMNKSTSLWKSRKYFSLSFYIRSHWGSFCQYTVHLSCVRKCNLLYLIIAIHI